MKFLSDWFFDNIVGIISLFVSLFIFIKYNQLNRLLKIKEENNIKKSKQAFITAKVISENKNDSQKGVVRKIQILNVGQDKAQNVEFLFDKDSQWGIRERIFPLDFMNANQEILIPLSIYLNSKPTMKVSFVWKDREGSKKNEIILTY